MDAQRRRLVAVWAAVGGVLVVLGVIVFLDPELNDPVTSLDYFAVWLFSLALALLAVGVALFGRIEHPRPWIVPGTSSVALAFLVASLANAVEHGLDVGSAAVAYVIGILLGVAGLIGLAVLLFTNALHLLGGVSLLTAVGLFTTDVGGMVVAGFGWLCLAALTMIRGDPRGNNPIDPAATADSAAADHATTVDQASTADTTQSTAR